MIGIIIGTGPSLTPDVIKTCNDSGHKLFGCNLSFRELNLTAHLACNYQWWDEYWEEIKDYPCDKWTPRKESADKYGINYIREVWKDGLSTDPSEIHAHHGSGPQILNIALHYGVTKFLLVGWDMQFKGKVDKHNYTEKRHYFGEYPASLQHWPRTGPKGELEGLIKEMETIHPEDYGIEIINCTPDSAMKCFPFGDLECLI